MATEANGVASSPAPPPQQAEKPSSAPTTATESPASAPAGTPKLSNAELKAKAKAEKAARRAQAKEAKVAQTPATPQSGAAGGDGKGGAKSGKGKQDAQQQQGLTPGGAAGRSSHQRRPSAMGRRPSIVAAVEKDVRADIPDCFSHIPMAKRIATSLAHKDVHPAALALGQQMAAFAVRDSIDRLKCTLMAFKQVSQIFFFLVALMKPVLISRT